MLGISIQSREAKTTISTAMDHMISVIIAKVNVTMVIQMVGRRNGPLLGIPGESLVTFAPTSSRLRRGAWAEKKRETQVSTYMSAMTRVQSVYVHLSLFYITLH